jgi:hypothetical protein
MYFFIFKMYDLFVFDLNSGDCKATVSRGYRGKTHLRGFKSESAEADFVCLAAVLTAVATEAKPQI